MILVLNFLVTSRPKSIALKPGDYRVGREEDNDIILNEFTVSRKHCLLLFKKGGWWIKDLRSKNGVYVEGKRIKGKEELKNGMKIHIGSIPIEVRLYSPRDYLEEGITRLPVRVSLWEDTVSLSSSTIIEKTVKENLLRLLENMDSLPSFELENQLWDILTMVGVEGFGAALHSEGEVAELISCNSPGLLSVYSGERPDRYFQKEVNGKVLTNVPVSGASFFIITSSPPPPWLISILKLTVRYLALMRRFSHFRIERGEELINEDSPFPNTPIVFESPEIKAVLEQVKKIASLEGNVLIEGESGVGKEIIARLIHIWSPRHSGKFVAVSVPAIPETLAESEFFGVKAGAVTGVVGRKGRFEEADGGTLFLDEIGEIPNFLQAKLLRAVETGEITKIGENMPIKVDVRVISATNRELEKMVEEGNFRSDLYFRLAEFKIKVPPLRERRKDIIPLAEAYARQFSKIMGKVYTGMSEEAREALLSYPWPGNIRELKNIIKTAVMNMEEDGIITRRCLPLRSEAKFSGELERSERDTILRVLERTNWNKSRAAEILGISRQGLINKMKRLGIKGPVDKGRKPF